MEKHFSYNFFKGAYQNKVVLIPRMPLIPTNSYLPFDFQRNQFPIRPCFCMTINKSQGQTLEFVSLWLGPDHVFTHGQLYVALSRVSSIRNIKVAIDHPNFLTRNVVYKEIFINFSRHDQISGDRFM